MIHSNSNDDGVDFRVTNQFEELEMVDDRMIYCLHGERSIEFSALISTLLLMVNSRSCAKGPSKNSHEFTGFLYIGLCVSHNICYYYLVGNIKVTPVHCLWKVDRYNCGYSPTLGANRRSSRSLEFLREHLLSFS